MKRQNKVKSETFGDMYFTHKHNFELLLEEPALVRCVDCGELFKVTFDGNLMKARIVEDGFQQ